MTTRERTDIRKARIADPTNQPEVKKFLALVNKDWARIYRLHRLKDLNTRLSKVQRKLFDTPVGSLGWHEAGTKYLRLVADRIGLDGITSNGGRKPKSLPAENHCLKVPISQLAALYLRQGGYRTSEVSDQLLPPSPLWSMSEFVALAKKMEWGEAARDLHRSKLKEFPDFMDTPEADHPFLELTHFRQMLHIIAGNAGNRGQPLNMKKNQIDVAVQALIVDIQGLDEVLAWFRLPWTAVSHDDWAVQSLRRVIPSVLSKLVALWRTVDPRAVDYPDIPPEDNPAGT